MTTATKLGITFAAKVIGSNDRWSEFNTLRSEFMNMDTVGARSEAMRLLIETDDSQIRAFAKALGESSGTSVPESHADRIAGNILRTPARSSESAPAPAPRAPSRSSESAPAPAPRTISRPATSG